MFKEPNMFQDREAAGRALSRALLDTPYAKENPVVVCIPRGGITIGRVLSEELDCEMDICLVRRIVSPTDPDLSIAAVTENGDIHLSHQASWGMSRKYIEEMRLKELADLKQRRLLYNVPTVSLKRRTVILVDDGISSGATMLAALHAIRKENCRKVIVAVPICSKEAFEKLKAHNKIEEIISLNIPANFKTLPQFYVDFNPCTDIQVMEALRENRNKERIVRRRSSVDGRDSRAGSLISSDSDQEMKEDDTLVDTYGERFYVRDLQTGHRRRATPIRKGPTEGLQGFFQEEETCVEHPTTNSTVVEPIRTA
jgi:predicted phosphoribosyltransferase